jgi:hypothetical protein
MRNSPLRQPSAIAEQWDSHIEGGTRMRLVAVVPERLAVEQRGGLSGEDSAGREWDGVYLTRPADAKGGSWYGRPPLPAGGAPYRTSRTPTARRGSRRTRRP